MLLWTNINIFCTFDLSKRKIITSTYEWRQAHRIIFIVENQMVLFVLVSYSSSDWPTKSHIYTYIRCKIVNLELKSKRGFFFVFRTSIYKYKMTGHRKAMNRNKGNSALNFDWLLKIFITWMSIFVQIFMCRH